MELKPGTVVSVTWCDLVRNAELWHVNTEDFMKLEGFYSGLDKDLFCECAGGFAASFPMEKAMRSFPDGGLEKFLLLCVVANYHGFREYYRREELPEEMFRNIEYDLSIWLETLKKDLGYYGLTPRIFWWTWDTMNGGVKQIGRLQFNDISYFHPAKSIYLNSDGSVFDVPSFRRGNPPSPFLSTGDKVINLHIPASGRLNIEECRDSIRKICRFVEERYPDYDYRAVVCYSWLLDSQFRSLLPSESNIVKFQELGYNFTCEDKEQTLEVIWRLWGKKAQEIPASQLPRFNTITRNVADFLEGGGRFKEGLLVITREMLKSL